MKFASCSCSKDINHTRKYYRAIRSIQVYVTLLNIANQSVIFTWKLLCLGLCITSGYAAIAHFSDHPVFGIMYYVIFVDASLTYGVMYEKGFKVPELITKVRAALRMRVRQLPNKTQRSLLDRQVMSIPPVGIKVGGFHMLERTSSPIFLNYIVTNVVNMLVTFR